MDCQQERNTLLLIYKYEMNPNTIKRVNCQVNNDLREKLPQSRAGSSQRQEITL